MLSIPQPGLRKPAKFLINPAHQLSRGMSGCWPLGDANNGFAQDVSLFRRNGAFGAAPLSFAPGFSGGRALQFNDSTQYVDVGNGHEYSAISYCAWINGTAFSNAYSSVMSRYEASGAVSTILVKSSGKLAMYLGATGGTLNYDGSGTNTLSTGRWYFVALTYDAASGLKGYVNGLVDGSAAANGTVKVIGSNQTIQIGSHPSIAGRFFNGAIEGARIYARALSAAEIWQLYVEPWAGLVPGRQLHPGKSVSINYSLVADKGTFTLTGEPVTPKAAITQALAFGSYSLTGKNADFIRRYGFTLLAEAGYFNLTAPQAQLSKSAGWHQACECQPKSVWTNHKK